MIVLLNLNLLNNLRIKKRNRTCDYRLEIENWRKTKVCKLGKFWCWITLISMKLLKCH